MSSVIARLGLATCPDCGRLCVPWIPPGWHGAHLRRQPDGRVVLVNCQGRPVGQTGGR